MKKTLLRLDASSRHSGSVSRALADTAQQRWLAANPGGEVIVRDLVAQPIPHIAERTIAGFYTPADQLTPELREATALSDELIAELLAADTLLISTPHVQLLHPFGLKAYIDQIVRIGRTFAADETGLHGLVPDRPTFLATASGAVYSGTAIASLNFVGPYLTTLLGFLGITSVQQLAIEGTTMDAQVMEATQQNATQQLHASLA